MDFFPPFPDQCLVSDNDESEADGTQQAEVRLAGHPEIPLSNVKAVRATLESEFCAHDLESISPQLWLLTTQSSSNINPLHKQKVKGREIVIAHDPRLHLVWLHNRIFIKPLPPYLLSHDFWKRFLTPDRLHDISVPRAALGFLRTYRHLIRYETDFSIAQGLKLVPSDIAWESFCRLLSYLDRIPDSAVSGRYHYGEIRLSRLNFYAPFLLHRFYYEQVYGQYSDFFGRLFTPVLFVFAIVSTILNSLQVGVAVDQVSDQHWPFWRSVSRWFSVVSLLGTTVTVCAMMLLWIWILVDEWVFAIKSRQRRRS